MYMYHFIFWRVLILINAANNDYFNYNVTASNMQKTGISLFNIVFGILGVSVTLYLLMGIVYCLTSENSSFKHILNSGLCIIIVAILYLIIKNFFIAG